jgi:hypothetical protein
MSDKWIKTAEQLPAKEYLVNELGQGCVDSSHADCYIFINGQVEERPYNFHHECWDDREYDDIEYEAKEPSHWMLAPPWPLPPKL